MQNSQLKPQAYLPKPAIGRLALSGVLAASLVLAIGCESQQAAGGYGDGNQAQRRSLDLSGSPAQLRQNGALEWSAAQQMAPAGTRGSLSGTISRDATDTYLRAGKYYMAASSNESNAQQAAADQLKAAHAYIRAGRAKDALAVIMPVANSTDIENDLRAQALYRAHQAHEALGDRLNADLAAKRLQFDYPLSRWAKALKP